jgi:Fe-S-cluster containining protein
MRSSEFIDTYLFRDEDGDYVFKGAPCPFLGADNACLVYEDRPKACREYPHTDRKNMLGILDLTLKNTLVCPAVLKIFYEIGKDYKK